MGVSDHFDTNIFFVLESSSINYYIMILDLHLYYV